MAAAHTTTFTPESANLPEKSVWRKLPIPLAVVGLLGLGATWALGADDPKATLYSYLVAYMFFLTISLGAAFFVAIQFLTRAGWSVVVRRIMEGLMTPLPVLAVLFAPLLLGATTLFKWTDTSLLETDPILVAKVGYLNLPFWTIRSIAYLVIFIGIAVFLVRLSLKQDKTREASITEKLQFFSPLAIGLLALSLTFASIDWVMSLDFHWYSTMFGVYIFAGAFVAALALTTCIALVLRMGGTLSNAITLEHYHDLGKLVFGFTVFWTYIAFGQYFLIWYANMPETSTWFMKRTHTEWMPMTALLVIGHFLLPFAYLMSRTIKRTPVLLLIGVVWLVGMHYIDLYWIIVPHNPDASPALSLTDITALVGIGGLFFATLGWFFGRHPLVPVGDPRLNESLHFENF